MRPAGVDHRWPRRWAGSLGFQRKHQAGVLLHGKRSEGVLPTVPPVMITSPESETDRCLKAVGAKHASPGGCVVPARPTRAAPGRQAARGVGGSSEPQGFLANPKPNGVGGSLVGHGAAVCKQPGHRSDSLHPGNKLFQISSQARKGARRQPSGRRLGPALLGPMTSLGSPRSGGDPQISR